MGLLEGKMDCFLCKKHLGEIAAPPGNYIYADAHWMVCHAPVDKGLLGTLLVESRRHFLDFSEALSEETAGYGPLMKKVLMQLKVFTGAERIYQVIMLEGVPHFHAWLVPRRKEILERGIKFLEKEYTCREEEAVHLAAQLREALNLP